MNASRVLLPTKSKLTDCRDNLKHASDGQINVSYEGHIWNHKNESENNTVQIKSSIQSAQNTSSVKKLIEWHRVHQAQTHSYDKILVTIHPIKRYNTSESYLNRRHNYVHKRAAEMLPNAAKTPIQANCTSRVTPTHSATDENGRVGLLLSCKALVQLVMNPAIGAVTANIGYHLPLFIGSISLMVASLLFAFGQQFLALLFARSLQGIASACISISVIHSVLPVVGMCLVAEQFPDDVVRSRVMGFVLGSMALGVLLGYPFGSLLYDFVGKMTPFLIISAVVFFNGVLQLFFLDLKPVAEHLPVNTSWYRLLSDGQVLLIAGSIWLTTSSMAILEPCLPIWLMDNIKPKKWQLGMVFIPDSIGYFLGTNFFGSIAYQLGRWRVAISAMVVLGISCVLVPSASNVSQLIVPHFCLGLGIGIVDAALVPLLANLMDSRYAAHYGSVYALQQMAVSLAYSLGPLVGGEMVRAIGFPWLMRSVGLLNLLYCPLLAFYSYDAGYSMRALETSPMTNIPAVNYKTNTVRDDSADSSTNLYRRFLNSEDSD
ncbi:hypothetical protein C0J52_00383 [Blattella germanica]|nr:hypothetical protein C0J52_00383 [Blattella germanica]